MSDVAKRVIELIADELSITDEGIEPEDRFVEDLQADSLDVVSLGMVLSIDFDVEISDEEAAGIRTVADAVALVERKTKES